MFPVSLAMLSFLFTARYPNLVTKLILISSGPFEASYAANIMATRLSRLSEEERKTINELPFEKFAEILFRADSYNAEANTCKPIEYQYELHQQVWNEAKELRQSGKMLAYAALISCPVIAIHGEYDPHPFQGVQIPLSAELKDFRFILLEKCGHYPWYEKEAQKEFYHILQEEILTN